MVGFGTIFNCWYYQNIADDCILSKGRIGQADAGWTVCCPGAVYALYPLCLKPTCNSYYA